MPKLFSMSYSYIYHNLIIYVWMYFLNSIEVYLFFYLSLSSWKHLIGTLHLWITFLFIMSNHFHWIEGIQLYCFCLMFFRIVIFNKEKSLFNASEDTCYVQIHVKILKGWNKYITLISDYRRFETIYLILDSSIRRHMKVTYI